jgi:drug/metabolite transporter (DMT)-like permease
MNYTGSAMAGPTLFAIIYSSVTIWAAVLSRVLLGRRMGPYQWLGIVVVFAGLAVTAFDSVALGGDVLTGSLLVLVGAALHSTTYVLSEAIMTRGETLDARMNCLLQGVVACSAFLLWQIVYTLPRFEEKLGAPMRAANTTPAQAAGILFVLYLANLVHSFSFQYTLKNFPGGATSAGVMKGLQAVLVFVVTSLVFCGRTGGDEMCFTVLKLVSLVAVVLGVGMYGTSTERRAQARARRYARVVASADTEAQM